MKPSVAFLLPVFVFLCGCNTVYIPATPSTPVFEGKGQIVATSSVGLSGVNFNISHSPVKHFYYGAEAFGLWSGRRLIHSNAGAHLGFYRHFRDSTGGINLQGGFRLGESAYETDTRYKTYFGQIFAASYLRRATFGMGLRLDIYKGENQMPPPVFMPGENLKKNLLIPCAFLFLQSKPKRNPGLSFFMLAGFQGPDLNYGFVDFFELNDHYHMVIFRTGLRFQFRY